jgi:diguanylate cyclase (GGDEF)-like protein
VHLALTLVAAGVLYSAFYAAVVGFAAGAAWTAAGAAAAGAALVGLRSTGRVVVVGHALTAILYTVLVAVAYHAGGMASAVMPWLAVPPMVAALLIGRRAAVGWTLACVVVITAFRVAEAVGVRLPDGVPAAWVESVRLAGNVGLVTCVATMCALYDGLRDEAQARAAAATAELARLAYHDALTGVANRPRFLERAAAALERARAAGDPEGVAVLALDLDGFKQVNDTMGHAAGDAVLVEVARRLLSATRGSDLVARLGGDEFAVLLDGVHGDGDVHIVAERIVDAVRRPVAVGGAVVAVDASVGIRRGAVRARGDGAPSVESEVGRMLHEADVAMYRAKAGGRGRWAWYEPAVRPIVPAPPHPDCEDETHAARAFAAA